MTSKELWQRYCHYLNIYDELGISLDISRMRFDEGFLENIRPKVEAAFSQMQELEAGAIANPDEKRMVGHYWLRTPKLAPDSEIGDAISSAVNRICDFATRIHLGTISPQSKGTFKNVLLIGIGGSALGPQLVSDALWNQNSPMKLYFCDNTDPDGIARTLTQIGRDLENTLCLVISKSGGTVETRNGQLEVRRAYTERGLDFGRHAIAITCQGSKLDNLAEEENWLERFYIWDWVGGRTSIFSAVGLLPAALQGIDVRAFLEGAQKMDELTRLQDVTRNPAAVLASMWFFAGEGKGLKDMVIIPYKDRLCLMSKYLQQLIMESLGKEKDLNGNTVNQGIAVYGNKGSTDQHAYIQQLREGLNNFFVTFIEVLEDYTKGSENISYLKVESGITSGDYLSGFLLGTRRALFENGRDSVTFTLERLDEQSLGALIALYDRTVGLYASLVNVNAYHQPGVEAGKKAAARVVALQKELLEQLSKEKDKEDGLSPEELSIAVGAPEEVETVYKILEHLAANPERGVMRTGERHPTTIRYRKR